MSVSGNIGSAPQRPREIKPPRTTYPTSDPGRVLHCEWSSIQTLTGEYPTQTTNQTKPMKLNSSLAAVSACLLLGGLTSLAQPAFPPPPGGWTYIYNGNQLIVGDPGTGWTSLDGTWTHDNGSDEWDGSTIGGEFSTGGFGIGNGPGGTILGTQSGVDYLRIQVTGDPRDYGYPDPSNRKIYFGHNIGSHGQFTKRFGSWVGGHGGSGWRSDDVQRSWC